MSEKPHRLLMQAHTLFLGSAVPDETAAGMEAFQKPIRKVYNCGEGRSIEGIESWLSLYTSGILLERIADKGESNVPLVWFPIQNMTLAASTKLVTYVDSLTGQKVTSFMELNSSQAKFSKNPPLFSVIMRKATGRRVLQCHTFLVEKEEMAMKVVDIVRYAYKSRAFAAGPPPEQLINLKRLTVVDSDDDDFDSVSATGRQRNGKNPGSPTSNQSEAEEIFPRRLVKRYNLDEPSQSRANRGPKSRPPIPNMMPASASYRGEPFGPIYPGATPSSSMRSHISSSSRAPLPPGFMMGPRVETIRYVPVPSRPQIIEKIVQVPVHHVHREIVEVPVPDYRGSLREYRPPPNTSRDYKVFDDRFENGPITQEPTIVYGEPNWQEYYPPRTAIDDRPYIERDYSDRDSHQYRNSRNHVDSRDHIDSRGDSQDEQGRDRKSRSSKKHRQRSHSSSSSSSERDHRKDNDYHGADPRDDPRSSIKQSGRYKYSSDYNGNVAHLNEVTRHDRRESRKYEISEQPANRVEPAAVVIRKKKSSTSDPSAFRWSHVEKPVSGGRNTLMNKPASKRPGIETKYTRRQTHNDYTDYKTRRSPERDYTPDGSPSPRRRSHSHRKRSPSPRRRSPSPRRSASPRRRNSPRPRDSSPRNGTTRADVYEPPPVLSQPKDEQYFFKEANTKGPPRNWMDGSKSFTNERAFEKSLAEVLKKRGRRGSTEGSSDEPQNAYTLNGIDETMDDRQLPPASNSFGPGVIPAPPPVPK